MQTTTELPNRQNSLPKFFELNGNYYGFLAGGLTVKIINSEVKTEVSTTVGHHLLHEARKGRPIPHAEFQGKLIKQIEKISQQLNPPTDTPQYKTTLYQRQATHI